MHPSSSIFLQTWQSSSVAGSGMSFWVAIWDGLLPASLRWPADWSRCAFECSGQPGDYLSGKECALLLWVQFPWFWSKMLNLPCGFCIALTEFGKHAGDCYCVIIRFKVRNNWKSSDPLHCMARLQNPLLRLLSQLRFDQFLLAERERDLEVIRRDHLDPLWITLATCMMLTPWLGKQHSGPVSPIMLDDDCILEDL